MLSKGRELPLRPKTFEVLQLLLRRPGQLVTKAELLEGVWANRFVGDAVLKASIRELRRALGDDPKVPRFIETVHRRGYRLVGQILVIEPAKSDLSFRRVAGKGPELPDEAEAFRPVLEALEGLWEGESEWWKEEESSGGKER
ncbi:MAG: winged helix-turn-helix domain-containing protein, partial [Acidobacteriota bacterium]